MHHYLTLRFTPRKPACPDCVRISTPRSSPTWHGRSPVSGLRTGRFSMPPRVPNSPSYDRKRFRTKNNLQSRTIFALHQKGFKSFSALEVALYCTLVIFGSLPFSLHFFSGGGLVLIDLFLPPAHTSALHTFLSLCHYLRVRPTALSHIYATRTLSQTIAKERFPPMVKLAKLRAEFPWTLTL